VEAVLDLKVSITERGKDTTNLRITKDLSGQLSLQELLDNLKATLIYIGETALDEEQARGFDKNPTVIVDNKRNKSVKDVSPFGKIEYVSRINVAKLLLSTYQAILDRSPVDTGLYKKSNYVVYNNTQIATDMAGLEAWLKSGVTIKDKDKFRFINVQPYARKLERLGISAQKRAQRTSKSKDKLLRSGPRILAPNGAYFLAHRAIKKDSGRNAFIKFGFTSGQQLGLSGSFKSPARDRAQALKGKARAYLYPTITVYINSTGFE
jgi:hypothetical protein